MQNPNEDTEWNDVLRAKGILPPKEKEVSEDEIVDMIEQTIQQKQNEKDERLGSMTLGELDELEDSEDEAVLEAYRRRRIAELRQLAERPRFAELREISGQDYVREVTQAGDDVWVVLHLYKHGVQQCALLNQLLGALAGRFPHTKFVRAVAQTCVPNFPEEGVPALLVYRGGALRHQLHPHQLRGTSLTLAELEYLLGQAGAVPSELTEDPRPPPRDQLLADLGRDLARDDW